MAKVSTRVSKTSGQGVSRKSYQMAYDLGQHGTGGLADFKSGGRDYAKSKGAVPKGSAPGDIGVTDTAYQPENLSALNMLFKDPAPKPGASNRPNKPKALK